MDIFNRQERFKEDMVLTVLNQVIDDSEIREDALYVKALDLTIGVQVPYVNGAVAQFIFILKHEMFQEDLVEAIAGSGRTFEEAVASGVHTFKDSLFKVLEKALKQENSEVFEVQIANQVHSYKGYRGEPGIQGHKVSGESVNLWEILKEEVRLRLGNKKIYIVKVYVSKTAQGVNCECRVNGLAYDKLSSRLKQIANEWEVTEGVYAERQVFVFVQDEITYVPYGRSKKEVESQTLNALLQFRECGTEEAYKKLYENLQSACGESSLATELYYFIPEIFTEIIFSEAQYSEEVVLARGEERLSLYRRQLTSYDWIYQVVERTIRAGYFEKPQVDRIIQYSASFNSLTDSLRKGSQMKDLLIVGIGFIVPLNYEVR